MLGEAYIFDDCVQSFKRGNAVGLRARHTT